MKCKLKGLIAVSATLLLTSVSNPLTSQANQGPVLGISGMQFARPLARPLARPSWHGRDGKTVEFDAPGATKVNYASCDGYCGTFALGNNGAGTIVGYYTDKYRVPHGFIRARDGHFSTFEVPGAGLGHGLFEGTFPYAINAEGALVGQYEDANAIFHGFVRERNGTFSTFNVPGAGTTPDAGQGTYAWDLNGYGDTAGVYVDSKGVEHGFLRSRDRHITTFDPPGSVYTFVCLQTCLSDVGIVGRYADKNSVFHAFLREPNGTIRTFDAPGAGRGANQGTAFQSVNANGTIAGALRDSHSVYHAFVRYPNGKYLIGQLPGAGTGPLQGTVVKSINAFDAIAGEVIFADNTVHAYARFANGSLFRFDPPDAAADTETSTNNASGEIAGYYSDKNHLYHGFLWVP